MALLSNFDILDICKYFRLPLCGIFMKNQLPKIKKIGYYVVNMASSTDFNGGTHWVVLCIIPDKRFYFDSFGFGPPQLVEKWMKPYEPYYINPTRLQYETSSFCGWYCIAVMYHSYNWQPKGKSNIESRITSFNKLFNKKDYKGNYQKMIEYFDDIFKAPHLPKQE